MGVLERLGMYQPSPLRKMTAISKCGLSSRRVLNSRRFAQKYIRSGNGLKSYMQDPIFSDRNM